MNIGLVLSGGGVRGIAHIGAIKALEEYNIKITHIAGTSAGAIVGALYAAENSWEEMLNFFKEVEIFTINKYAINKPGFIDTEKFYESFKPYFPKDNFENLKLKLYITATNLLNGELKVFNKGELIRPILASAAFPGIFTPIKIDNVYYIDGGTLNNFPVNLITEYCNHIIGVYVTPFEAIKKEDLKHSYSILERAFRIKNSSDSRLKFNDCDLLIRPNELSSYGTFYFKNVDEIFNLGYQSAKEALKSEKGFKIMEAINK